MGLERLTRCCPVASAPRGATASYGGGNAGSKGLTLPLPSPRDGLPGGCRGEWICP